jgi:hypothetical protein
VRTIVVRAAGRLAHLTPRPLRRLGTRLYRRPHRTPTLDPWPGEPAAGARAPRIAWHLQGGVVPDGATRSVEPDTDVCVLGPGGLDDALELLQACERQGVPSVCVVSSDADIGSEVAACCSALLVLDPSLLGAATRVVPGERVGHHAAPTDDTEVPSFVAAVLHVAGASVVPERRSAG